MRAWSPAKGNGTLRNPSDRSEIFAPEAGAAFELPASAAGTFHVRSPYPDSPAPVSMLRADEHGNLTLRPFAVQVSDCVP